MTIGLNVKYVLKPSIHFKNRQKKWTIKKTACAGKRQKRDNHNGWINDELKRQAKPRVL